MLAQHGDSIPSANTSVSSLVSLLNDKSKLFSLTFFSLLLVN